MEARLCHFALSIVFFFVSTVSFAQSETQRQGYLNNATNTSLKATISVADKLEATLASNDIESAIDLYEIMRSEPLKYRTNEKEMTQLGLSLMLKGQIDASIAVLQFTTQSYPLSWLAHENLGNAYLVQGNLKAAENSFDKATDLKGSDDIEQEHFGSFSAKIIN